MELSSPRHARIEVLPSGSADSAVNNLEKLRYGTSHGLESAAVGGF